MPDSKVGIPLAFVLALSLPSANAEASASGDLAGLLKPGSLQNLLDRNEKPLVNGPSTEGRITQVCFQGYWRRC